MEFRTRDGRFALEIGENERAELENFCVGAGTHETGGILIGSYTASRDKAILKQVTSAPDDSRAGATWFHRGTRGLQELLDELWSQGCYYLGEWHYHPEGTPRPSECDSKQLRSIASRREYRCPEPLLLIATIPAKLELGAFIYPTGEGPIELERLPTSPQDP